MYIPILLAVPTGMRRGEILRLRWENVDLKNRIIKVVDNYTNVGTRDVLTTPKSYKSVRSIALLDITIKALKEHRKNQTQNRWTLKDKYENNDLVCCWEDGSYIKGYH